VTNTETAPPGITPTTGRWLLVTESSAYELDLDAHTCRRTPGAGAGPTPGRDVIPPSELRKDNDAIPLIELGVVLVGFPAIMVVDVRGDGVLTSRQTTMVRELRELPAAL